MVWRSSRLSTTRGRSQPPTTRSVSAVVHVDCATTMRSGFSTRRHRLRVALLPPILSAVVLVGAPLADPGRANSAAAPERVVFKVIKLQQHTHPAYDIDLSYPQIENSGLPAESRINAELQYAAQSDVANFVGQLGTRSAPSSVPSGGSDVSSLGGGVQLDLLSNHAVSVLSAVSWNWPHAAHPEELFAGYTYNGSTGDPYQLSDLFAKGSDWLTFLSNESRYLLLKSLGGEADPSTIAAGTKPKSSNFSDWTLTPWGLNIQFADDQVGPHAIGDPSVLI
jgi:hypothetical protein